MSTAIADLLTENIVEGDDVNITWTMTDSSTGDPYDFTGVSKMWFTLKKDLSDADIDALIAINTIDDSSLIAFGSPTPGDGKVWVHLQATSTTDCANYNYTYYDIQILKNSLISTLVKGRIVWKHEVTLATS